MSVSWYNYLNGTYVIVSNSGVAMDGYDYTATTTKGRNITVFQASSAPGYKGPPIDITDNCQGLVLMPGYWIQDGAGTLTVLQDEHHQTSQKNATIVEYNGPGGTDVHTAFVATRDSDGNILTVNGKTV